MLWNMLANIKLHNITQWVMMSEEGEKGGSQALRGCVGEGTSLSDAVLDVCSVATIGAKPQVQDVKSDNACRRCSHNIFLDHMPKRVQHKAM